jgi:ABC-type branched-subunit amino acid transport system substrate-binding protein
MRRLAVVLAALVAAVPAAAADAPGVTAKTITIGGSVPLSGPETAYAPVARGAEAYFKHVNARGGVHGRKIVYKILDDGYDPARTVQATRELVQQERVLAIFNTTGTEHNAAIRPYLNAVKVPQLFVGTGAQSFIKGPKRFPWTVPFLPSFVGEGALYGRHLAQTKPAARIAVLYEASEYGRDMLNGLKRGLAGKGRIVGTETYNVTDVDLSSQMAKLKSSNANVLMLFSLPKQAIQSFVAVNKLGWRPQIYMSAVSIDPFVMDTIRLNTGKLANGAVSMNWLRDPSNPREARDPGVKLYKQLMKRYLPRANPREVAHIHGMAAAWTLVETLKKAGKSPTRAKVQRAAASLRLVGNPFLRPGIDVRTSPTRYEPLAKVQLLRYSGAVWMPLGKLVSSSG